MNYADEARQLIKFFEYFHLPPTLQIVSGHFYGVVHNGLIHLPDSAEKVAALRKLLEAKDCAVRAALG